MRNQAEVHERVVKPDARQDRFAAWVRQYGVSRLTRVFGRNPTSSRSTIYWWFKHDPAKRRWPEADTAAVLIFLSEREPLKEDGLPLTWDDIYGELAAASVQHFLNGIAPSSRADVIAAAASAGASAKQTTATMTATGCAS